MPISSMMIIASGTVARIDRRCASVAAGPKDFRYTRSPGAGLYGRVMDFTSRSADACDLERKYRPVGFDDRDLPPEAHRDAIELQEPVRFSVAAHRPVVTRGNEMATLVAVARPMPSNSRPGWALDEGVPVHDIGIVERQSNEIGAAHRPGRKVSCASKLQAN